MRTLITNDAISVSMSGEPKWGQQLLKQRSIVGSPSMADLTQRKFKRTEDSYQYWSLYPRERNSEGGQNYAIRRFITCIFLEKLH